jgi:hypothetical protein
MDGSREISQWICRKTGLCLQFCPLVLSNRSSPMHKIVIEKGFLDVAMASVNLHRIDSPLS